MELNSKKLERTSKIIYNSISIILCVFLILLSNKIVDDLDNTTEQPEVASFENRAKLNEYEAKIKTINVGIENLENKKKTIEKTITAAQENYINQKQSFDIWLQTRRTLGSPEKDQELTERAEKLDEYYKVEQDWRTQLYAHQQEIDLKTASREKIQLKINTENEAAAQKLESAQKSYELKLFLIRLLFVTPILALGIFFFIRYRRHKFWPLYFGFTLFSFYAFFFGLVPYLPSYGGYVRYAVGIILSVGLGYYAIKTIRNYIEQKQAELKVSTQERSKNVQTEVAEKALSNHFCPSCGKDFIIMKWEAPLKGTDNEQYKLVTDFCRHCGLELFTDCKNCGHKNFAHLPYCSACGTRASEK